MAIRLLPHVALALALASALGGCSKSQAREEQSFTNEVRRREAVRVRTVPIEQREMVRTTTTTTTIESEKEIEIFPRATGVVSAILVEEGDRVEAGAVLAELDDREALVTVREAELSLKEAREGIAKMELAREEAAERLERARLTWEQSVRDVERNESAGLISRSELDQLVLTRDQSYRDLQAARLALDSSAQDEQSSRTAVEKAQVTLERQQLNASYTKIYAPFTGVVATRSIKVGDAVSASASAFVLTDTENLRAVFARPQRDLPLFRRGTKDDDEGTPPIEIRVEAEAIPDREYRGEVRLVSPTIDAASGSFRVTVGLSGDEDQDSNGLRLLPGMLVRLQIVTDRHPEALVVPKRALRREGDVNFMFLLEDKTARRVSVREGFSDDEFVEIVSDDERVRPGVLVVAVGNRDLEDGDEVEPEAWGAPDEEADRGSAEQPEPGPQADDPAADADEDTSSDTATAEQEAE